MLEKIFGKIFATFFRIILGLSIIAALSLLVLVSVLAATDFQSIVVLLLIWLVPAYMMGAGAMIMVGRSKRFVFEKVGPVRNQEVRDVQY